MLLLLPSAALAFSVGKTGNGPAAFVATSTGRPPSSSAKKTLLFSSAAVEEEKTTAEQKKEVKVVDKRKKATPKDKKDKKKKEDDVVEDGNKVMWTPKEEYMKQTAMYKFRKEVLGDDADGYQELWEWSKRNDGDDFWKKLMDFVDVEYEGSLEPVKKGTTMPDVTYFPNVKLNFAENMLKHGKDDSPSILIALSMKYRAF